MKRLALFAAGVLLVGCAPKTEISPSEPAAGNSEPTTVVAPAPTAAPAPTINPAPVAAPAPAPTPPPAPSPVTGPNPAAIPDTSPSVGSPPPPAVVAPAPAKDVPIFETVKDGKTYVFTSIAAMNAFTVSGTQEPVVSEKPNLTGNGATVVIEAADAAQAEQMIASYHKLHPPVVK